MAEQNLFSFAPLCHQKNEMVTDRSRIMTLQFQAQTVAVRTVLALDDTSHLLSQQIHSQLSDDAYGILRASILEKIKADFPKMLTDELLYLLAPPHTKHLDLSGCYRVSWEGMMGVISRCANLRTLVLSDCQREVIFALFNIRQPCPQLTSLNLSSNFTVDDRIVWHALRQWPLLSHLDLSYCDNITDDCFHLSETKEAGVDEAGPVSSHGASLGTDGHKTDSCPGRKLVSVDLSGCLQLTTKCIRHLTELCGPTLQALNIGYTSVDCSALWFLCGYNLSTAVQLAVALDNKGACPPMQDNKLLSPELIQKILTGEVHHGNQQPITIGVPDDGMDEESSEEGALGLLSDGGKDCSEEGRDVVTDESSMMTDSWQDTSSVGGATSMSFEGGQEGQGDLCVAPKTSNPPHLFSSKAVGNVSYTALQKGEDSENAACSASATGSMCVSEKPSASGEHHNSSWKLYSNSDLKNSESCVFLEGSSGNFEELDVFIDKVIANSKQSLLNAAMENASLTQEPGRSEVEVPFGESKTEHVNKPTLLNNTGSNLDKCNSDIELAQSQSFPDLQNSNSQPEPGILNSANQSKERSTGFKSSTSLPVEDRTQCLSLDDVQLTVSEIEQADTDMQNFKELNSIFEQSIASATAQSKSSDDSYYSNYSTNTSSFVLEASSRSKGQENNVANTGHCGKAKAKDSGTLLHDDRASQEKNGMLQSGDGRTPEDDGIPLQQRKSDISNEEVQNKLRLTKRPQALETRARKCERTFQLQSYQPNITSLDISGMNMSMNSADIGDACIKAFVSANRNLRKLSLTWKEIKDETVEFIGQHAKELRYLSMIDCDRTSPYSLACVAQHCSKLDYLDVKGMSFIGDAGLIPLVVNNQQLQTLCLAECNITDLSLDKIAKFLGPVLTCLDLSWCEEITDSGLSAVVSACPHLQQLSLRQCLSTAHTLVRLGENCQQLRSLMMSGVEGMSDGVLISLVENLGLLEQLDVSWNLDLTDLSISRVLICCPRLRDARLAGLKRITSKPFLPIISDLARWRRCQSLLKLKEKERRVFLEEGEEHLSSDEEFEDLYIPHRSSSYAPCMRSLDLEYSDKVNDDHLAEIVAVCHGTLQIRDYYGEYIQPTWTGSMHFFM